MRKQIEVPTAAVLDVGSFSARLVVLSKGGTPLDPMLSHQTRLRLDRELDDDGKLSRRGIDAVSSAVEAGMTTAAKHGVEDVYPLATSSIRDAANVKQVVCDVAKATGVKLQFLTGRREAELAYVGARRWYGASAGGLLVLDIGGGTVELAAGNAEEAGFAHSLPLGARSLTRDWMSSECPSPKVVAAMRDHVLDEVRDAMQNVLPEIRDHQAVGCSKVLRQLARLAGDRPSRSRELHLDDLRAWIPRLAKLPAKRRAELPGISRQRSHQALAGAIVAEALLTLSGSQVAICPWSTRDGLLLNMLDGLVTVDGKTAKAA